MNEDKQTQIVQKLYTTVFGRFLLRILIRPRVSKLAGAFMDSRLSKIMIPGFIKKNNIDLSCYEKTEKANYRSFNDFFIRRIKPELRPVAMEWDALISPCDGRLSVEEISMDSRFQVKGRSYTMDELIRDEDLAAQYDGGTLLLFRLTVSDYHRYHYPDSGMKSDNTHIDGVFHTVHPIAVESRWIYSENEREYFILHSDNFDDMLMIQVGALLVGRICNQHEKAVVQRGQTAGWFEYGGSTVILCLKRGVAEIFPEIQEAARKAEVRVKMGQRIGTYRSREVLC